MICTICEGKLVYAVPPRPCFRCKGSGQVADGWEEPKDPPIDKIREIARECGYAVGVHGSLKRDYDIIACPWTDTAVGAKDLVDKLCAGLNAIVAGSELKPHGRYAYTVQIDGWFKIIDLSVMPQLVKSE